MSLFPPEVPEVAAPTPECPNPERWRCYDGMGTEVETLELLHSLVRAIKPEVCIETGTYLGYGTHYIASALRANGSGHLWTAEPDLACVTKAVNLLHKGELLSWATVVRTTGEELIQNTEQKVDFAFLDSNLDTRIGEMRVLRYRLNPGAVVAVHDTNTYHAQNNGPRYPFMDFADANGLDRLYLNTPRGLALFTKRVTR